MSEWDCKHGMSHDLCPVCFRERIRELEEERDIFARTLNKRDAECAEQHRVIDIRNQRIRELEEERDRLREAISNAPPVSESCWEYCGPDDCDCWKRKALEGE